MGDAMRSRARTMGDAMRAMELEIEALRQQVQGLGGTPVAHKNVFQRKKGVAICSEQIDDENYKPPIFPKSDGSRVLIEGAMAGEASCGQHTATLPASPPCPVE